MANLRGTERARYVQGMFDQIASVYDLMNRVMTAGQDIRWRREVVRRARPPRDGRILDLGVGTGDLTREALRQFSGCHVVGVDFALEMMRVGQKRLNEAVSKASRVAWVAADANRLPFPDGYFDSVFSGFLLRNLGEVRDSLAEQFRVLKSGGKIVALDTTPPRISILSPFLRFHLHTLIPLLGRLLARHNEAYEYLPDTTMDFLEAEVLAERLLSVGFTQVGFSRLMFGTVAIHWGVKSI